jgi:hypothetical protein
MAWALVRGGASGAQSHESRGTNRRGRGKGELVLPLVLQRVDLPLMLVRGVLYGVATRRDMFGGRSGRSPRRSGERTMAGTKIRPACFAIPTSDFRGCPSFTVRCWGRTREERKTAMGIAHADEAGGSFRAPLLLPSSWMSSRPQRRRTTRRPHRGNAGGEIVEWPAGSGRSRDGLRPSSILGRRRTPAMSVPCLRSESSESSFLRRN